MFPLDWELFNSSSVALPLSTDDDGGTLPPAPRVQLSLDTFSLERVLADSPLLTSLETGDMAATDGTTGTNVQNADQF